MKKPLMVSEILACIVFMMWLTIGCGGGGGGDSSGNAVPTAATQTLDKQTVDDTLGALDDIIPFCAMNSAKPTATTALQSVLGVGDEILGQVWFDKTNDVEIAAAPEQQIISGTCATDPGELTYSIEGMESGGGPFSGTLLFDSFCTEIETDENTKEKVTIHGGATFSGTMAFDSQEELQSLTLKFSTTGGGIAIDSLDGGADIVVNGLSISMNTDPSGNSSVSVSAANLTATTTDDQGLRTVAVNGLTASMTSSEADGVTLNASGTISDSEEGSVNFTASNLTTGSEGTMTGGSIVVHGANGTSITVAHDKGNDFSIWADTDGDGSNDYPAGIMCCQGNLGSDTLF